PITAEDTSASLHDKLALQRAEAIVAVLESEQTLQHYLETREVQDGSLPVYAHKLSKAEAQIDWTQPAAAIDRNIRAFNPWPVAFTPLDDSKNLRISNSSLSTQKTSNALPGEVSALDKDGVHAMCGYLHAICITNLQWPGGKALNAVQINQTQELSVGYKFA